MPQALIIGLIGLAAGILSGLFGIGGGIIIVPALMFFVGLTISQAAGTSLAALLLPVGILGVWVQRQAGNVDFRAAALIAAGLFFGAFIGAKIGTSIPTELLQKGFGILLVGVGIRILFFR